MFNYDAASVWDWKIPAFIGESQSPYEYTIIVWCYSDSYGTAVGDCVSITRLYYASRLSNHLNSNSFIDITSIHPFQLRQWTIPTPQLKLIYRHKFNSPVYILRQ